MLKYFLVGMGVVCACILGSCSKNTSTETTIIFQIADYDFVTNPVVRLGLETIPVEIDSSGKGVVFLNLATPACVEVEFTRYNMRTLYLESGKTLELSYSLAEKASDLSMKGELACENDFLNIAGFYETPRRSREMLSDFRLMRRQFDSVLQINHGKLMALSFNQNFKDMAYQRLELQTALAMLSFFPKTCDTSDYLDFVVEKWNIDTAYISLPVYRQFVERSFRRVRGMLSRVDTIGSSRDTDALLSFILSNVTEEACRSYLLDILLFPYGSSHEQGYIERYRKYVRDPKRLCLFEEAQRKVALTAPGQPCPEFCFKDVNDRDVTLADLKGKFVYIDVWATWCGPCKGEIPSLLKLEKALEGKDILFVGVSVDKNRDIKEWKSMVEEKELRGIQLHWGENQDWIKLFMPTGIRIPRFILLDKEGKIVNPDMSRPSDETTLLTLQKLLN